MYSLRKFLQIALILNVVLSTVSAQVSFSSMPKDNQFFPRNTVTNQASVTISGTVINTGVDYTSLRVKAYRDGQLIISSKQTLVFNNGIAPFNFNGFMKAELATYKVAVYGVNGTVETLIDSAINLVAGDAYLIQGQSNAEASMYKGNTVSLQSNFIRSYGTGNENGTTNEWYIASGDKDRKTGGHVGQWGLKMARLIVETYKIPVCIINGAQGGMAISFFLRNDSNPLKQTTNYGRTLKRVQEAGLANHIRAAFWYQGETDVLFQTDTVIYKNDFRDLYHDWKEDMPGLSACYIFQIRKSCSNSNERSGKIMECHRQLALELPNTYIMASNGASHFVDGCHFPYTNGYEFHAKNIFRLVQRDMYQVSNVLNIEPPQIIAAKLMGIQQIELTLKNVSDTYIWEAGSEKDFDINGANVTVVSGVVNANKITLTLSGNVTGAYSIDYFGHEGSNIPFVKNANGIGMVSVWEYPLETMFSKPVAPMHVSNLAVQ